MAGYIFICESVSHKSPIDFSEDWKIIMWWTSWLLCLWFFFSIFFFIFNESEMKKLLSIGPYLLKQMILIIIAYSRLSFYHLHERRYLFCIVYLRRPIECFAWVHNEECCAFAFIESDENKIEIKFQTSIQICIDIFVDWVHDADTKML